MAKNKNRKSARKTLRLNPPVLVSKMVWIAFGCALFGGALALYSTNLTFEIMRNGIIDPSGCSINSLINCDSAHASDYATLLGVPVGWWGFLFYLWAGLATFFAAKTQNKNSAAAAASITLVLSIGAVLFSFVKGYHLYDLGVICLVCLGMYIASLGIFISLLMALQVPVSKLGSFLGNYVKGVFGQPEALNFSPDAKIYIPLVAVIFGLGFVGVKNYEETNIPEEARQLQTELDQHFDQQQYTFAINENAVPIGNPDADIVLLEFGDFQCPACRQAAGILRNVVSDFADDVKLYYLHYPLDSNINPYMGGQLHPNAGIAAQAAVCAEGLGDFWDYHDDIFANQRAVGERLLVNLAEERGWDTEAFQTCMTAPETVQRVRNDIDQGRLGRISGTPSLFINGRKVSFSRNAEYISALIREEISRR